MLKTAIDTKKTLLYIVVFIVFFILIYFVFM